jgi:hypothetical protein
MQKWSMRVGFIVRGFACSHEQLAGALGIMPTETWHAGDLIANTLIKRRTIGWRLASTLAETAEADEQAMDVLKRLHPKRDVLRKIGPHEAKLDIAVYEIAERPPLVLSGDVVRMAADLNASIDIDLVY